ncbi:MAG: DNA primase [Candidatus Vogelbacteria bacterium RIFOXYD1_FULL_46_19]|uniref:DNA primase n=1 Tax=Candidatus Vogelbacteria bacterium RIFOXYD1_FULL_46_19 TaxID=1802439 RepID=A0A1G2QGF5_9BACT|nr:MAG: DNA primase [Candidatus Vogelbacteria bacterium RIFOXYD1_FULL_46_19]
MSTPVEQIKDRLNIVDVVSSYLKLDKAGINYKTRCPFHNEKSPSFFVSPSRQSYHCFGCNRGGDMISFVEEIEGVDFMGAVKILADRAGIEFKVGPATGSTDVDKDQVVTALAAAALFYEEQLKEAAEVNTYLSERGLTPESVAKFRLGFAPPGWQNIYNYLKARGFTDAILVKAGLVGETNKSGGKKVYDRFRGRIMFPLSDTTGTIVGFSGRLFDPSGTRGDEAKYLNSPQTIVYDKSKLLYGFPEAKVEIRRTDMAVLVEGQMDLVMAHQAGVVNSVAVSGTALTDRHLVNLKRLALNLVMSFDGDEAGLAASRRAVEMALAMGFEVRIAALPEGADPADVVRDKPELFQEAVTKSVHVIDFYLRTLSRRYQDQRARAHAIKDQIYPLLLRLTHIIDQAHFVKKIADVTSLAEEIVWQDLKNTPLPTRLSDGELAPSRSEPLVGNKPGERDLSRTDRILAQIIALWWWLEENGGESVSTSKSYRQLEDLAGTVYLKVNMDKLLPQKGEKLLAAEILYGTDQTKLELALQELEANFRQEFLKSELELIMKKMKEAESLHDEVLMDKYLKKCQDISKAINKKDY